MQLVPYSIFALAVLVCFAPSFISAQSAPCMICQLLVSTIDGYLKQNQTQEQIIKKLDVACLALPPPINTACTSFVQQWVPKLIDYLLKFADPATACAKIGVCFQSEELVAVDIQLQARLQEALKQ